jgi:uncharacterized protein
MIGEEKPNILSVPIFPIFFTDAPLRKLATWLRILGYRCHHCPSLSPSSLSFPVLPEPSDVVLTRQVRLPEWISRHFPRVESFLITDNYWGDQVIAVIRRFDLRYGGEGPQQCIRCGLPLQAEAENAGSADLADQIPLFIAETSLFLRACPGCKRVYWRGTHTKQMENQITFFFEKACTAKEPSLS